MKTLNVMKTIKTVKVNQEAIDKEKETLKTIIKHSQMVYDLFNKIGIELILDDLPKVSVYATTGSYWQQLSELIIERLLDLPKNKHLKTQSAFVRSQDLKVPDYKGVIAEIAKNSINVTRPGSAFGVNYLQLVKGKVSARPEADSEIKALYTTTTIVPDYAAINKRK